jgi:hypothetical protein
MKLMKRTTDDSLQLNEVEWKKTKLDSEEEIEDGIMSVDCIESPEKTLKMSQPERCQICLWPVTSPQCYHPKK